MNELIYKQDAIDALIPIVKDASLRNRNVYSTAKKCMRAIENLLSAESEIVRCKDCKNRGESECPMRHIERIEWEEDGYIEFDDIVHDYTEPYGYCDKGERNE